MLATTSTITYLVGRGCSQRACVCENPKQTPPTPIARLILNKQVPCLLYSYISNKARSTYHSRASRTRTRSSSPKERFDIEQPIEIKYTIIRLLEDVGLLIIQTSKSTRHSTTPLPMPKARRMVPYIMLFLNLSNFLVPCRSGERRAYRCLCVWDVIPCPLNARYIATIVVCGVADAFKPPCVSSA